MSKSYGNTIPVFDTPESVARTIRRIVTDSRRPEETKDPETSTVFQIYASIAEDRDVENLRQRFLLGGIGYGEAKDILLAEINARCQPARVRYEALMNDKSVLDETLRDGAERARRLAQDVLSRVRSAVGA